MNETGASKEEARRHIKNLVNETWKGLNRDLFNDKHRPFTRASQNLARASHWIYRYGGGHDIRSREARGHLLLILVRPVY